MQFKDQAISRPKDFVRWNELNPVFRRTFPSAVRDCLDNGERCLVRYQDVHYLLIPEVRGIDPISDFSVYGPPHVNRFP